MITPEVLEEFKERMHIDGDEDANLTRILTASVKALIGMCGKYDIEEDEVFKELVFERARYVYNDAAEYFKKNFLTEINSLSMANALKEMDEETTGEDIEKFDEQDFIRYELSDDDATV